MVIQGQVGIETSLGRYLYNLSMRDDLKNIVDIGTWNGLGTTKCIIDGIFNSNKKDYNLVSIEVNKEKHFEAKNNLSKYIDNNVKLMYGRITEKDELVNLNDYDDSFFYSYSRNIQEQWYKQTLIEHTETPNIYNKLLEITSFIDLLVLDGGEYCTYGEFRKLKQISKFVVLDDTNTIKNFRSAEEIRNSKNYEVIEDNRTERHGFLIAKNLEF